LRRFTIGEDPEMLTNTRTQLLSAAGLIALCVLTRLFAGIPGSAVVSVALFAGWLLRNRLIAIAVPLISMIVSDAVLGAYDLRIMATVYATTVFPALLGSVLGRKVAPVRIFAGTFVSALLAFLLANLAHWRFGPGGYPQTLEGLLLCYQIAFPFLLRRLVADCVGAAFLFGGFALVVRLRSPSRAAAPAFAQWNPGHFDTLARTQIASEPKGSTAVQ
jgi:hypothetical protein